ncbi:MAG: hypothetical protein HDT18_04435 [Oscillibacter sp.]|nr:hypothetical protein [Oscillibacter sp.]
MNWKDYTKSIQKSGMVDGSLAAILTNLFKVAECIEIPSLDAVRSWLYGRRNCKSSTYFPAGTINTNSVFHYFRKRSSDNLYNLQAIFKEQIVSDSDTPIDIKTRDLDIFCWTLVNQFLDLLKFERVDIPHPKEDTSIPGKELFPYNQKCCVYCIHWDGNRSIIGASMIPTEGTCCTHNGNIHRLRPRLSSDTACTNYEADQTLLNRMKELGCNVKDFV